MQFGLYSFKTVTQHLLINIDNQMKKNIASIFEKFILVLIVLITVLKQKDYTKDFVMQFNTF